LHIKERFKGNNRKYLNV